MSPARAVAQQLIAGRSQPVQATATAWAPVNIALCKYWGKRNSDLNLPNTSSLSISLQEGTTTTLALAPHDCVLLNGTEVQDSHIARYLDILRPDPSHHYAITTTNSLPTAAGLASSASGFAALALAFDALYGWKLDRTALSILARLGSGSACRSLSEGFVEWQAGQRDDGMDSVAIPLQTTWEALCVGVLLLRDHKPISSRTAMQRTVETSPLYADWPAIVARDLEQLRHAIATRNFSLLGATAEANALAMHATMLAALPPISYLLPESWSVIHRVSQLRAEGLEVYCTMDAGPNVKLLFLDSDLPALKAAFPDLRVVRHHV